MRRRAGLAGAMLALAACAAPQHRPDGNATAPDAKPPPVAHPPLSYGADEPHAELDIVGSTHVVQRGETVYRIAKTYGLDARELMEVNGLTDPRALQPGMELFIPGAPRALEVPPLPAGVVEPVPPAPAVPAQASLVHGNGKMHWPLQKGMGILRQGFGVRQGQRHDGIDLAAPEGTPVLAAAGGEVVYTGRQSGYGVIVILRHAPSLLTVYAHNSAVMVKEGDRVEAGTPIARVGQSGRTTGPHLHFEVREGTKPRDPLLFLP
ncbi:MAG TPA: M23 family metallopeptidase [Anaeromyxobacteraceae bacterium]|nr:M23 family metallopeptidase [Anaeromyxobacteraceae bacterium]